VFVFKFPCSLVAGAVFPESAAAMVSFSPEKTVISSEPISSIAAPPLKTPISVTSATART
jgi:hypothetical protein